MRTLLALLLALCLATPALAQIELPPDREAKLIAQEKATKAKKDAAKAAAAATAAAPRGASRPRDRASARQAAGSRAR